MAIDLDNTPIAPDKMLLFQSKSMDIFLISASKHMLWYPLEASRRGASNEYPQNMFLCTDRKIIHLIPPLIWNYGHFFFDQKVLIFFLSFDEILCCGDSRSVMIWCF